MEKKTALITGAYGGLGQCFAEIHAKAVSPLEVAQAGYDAMLQGELEVIAGLTALQKPFMNLSPMIPKKLLLDNVYKLQERGSADN